MTGENCGRWHKWSVILARVLIAAIFIYAGYGKVTNIAGTAGYIASVGLPAATFLAWASGLLELVGGILIVVGRWKKFAAWALAIFTLLATYFFHLKAAMGGDQMQIIMTLKNLAIVGGLMMIGGMVCCGWGSTSGTCGVCTGGTCGSCGGCSKEGESTCEDCKAKN